MRKQIVALMLLMVALTALVPAVLAVADENAYDTSSNYEIQNIGVSGQSNDNTVYVERGDYLPVEIYLDGTGETTDVNIRVWLGGYEYDDVSVTSTMFDVEDGVSYKKTLYLELPEDMDAEQVYTLYVEVYDSEESEMWTSEIMVSKVYHLLDIQDILVENAEAGDYVSVTVRLENMGDHKEEDVKVTVSVDELNIKTSEYLDELTNTEVDNEDEEDSGEVTLTFQVPKDAKTDDYTLDVLVTYNRGYDTVEESVSFHVDALEVEETEDDNSTVTIVVGNDDDEEETSEEVEDEQDFSTALRVGFGILAVLIVILALILIVRR
jgi:hypothetical protein